MNKECEICENEGEAIWYEPFSSYLCEVCHRLFNEGIVKEEDKVTLNIKDFISIVNRSYDNGLANGATYYDIIKDTFTIEKDENMLSIIKEIEEKQ